MKGYTFHVKSDDEFVAHGKNAVSMTIVCKEKTGFNDSVERAPPVRHRRVTQHLASGEGGSPSPSREEPSEGSK